MNSYKDLSQQLLSTCKPFFDKYKFSVWVDTGNELIMDNAFCRLRFFVDERLDYGNSFELKGFQRHSFALFQVFRFLKPEETKKYFDEEYYEKCNRRQIPETTKMDLDFLDTHLAGIVSGDSSWAKGLSTQLEYERRLVEYMMNHLSYDHPINKKFWGGDETWKTDLEGYLIDNNISIPKPEITNAEVPAHKQKAWWKFW